jgi:phenylacetate-CoA ligase
LEGFGLVHAIRLLAESERWDRHRLDALRDEKLMRVVERAYHASPHYRRMMDESGVRPGDIRGIVDLPKLPVLTKDVVRKYGEALRFRGDVPVELGTTGGSTGNPLKVVRDRAGSVWQRGCYWRGLGWGGLRLGEPYAQLFGGTLGVAQARRLERVKSWFAGKRFLPAFELGPHNAQAYLARIAASGARFLIGYTSALHLLACHAERRGTALRLTSVFPTAEPLLPGWREKIAAAFGAAVLPYYGCGEVQSLGYSCPSVPDVYHTCDEHSVIEVETQDGAALVGQGPFLVSDLDNHAFPMLRYRNGDAGVLGLPGCPCGRTLGRIERIDGRINDVLYATSGNAVSGAIGPHAFKMIEGIEQFQIVQRRQGHVCIRMVRLPTYAPAVEEAKLDEIFRHHLGRDAEIELEYVESIPRTAAGKARFIISEISAA